MRFMICLQTSLQTVFQSVGVRVLELDNSVYPAPGYGLEKSFLERY